jgi:tetratricopeptide (TPR) repeat protein
MNRHRSIATNYRRPFWFPASNYYVLAAAVTLAVFFIVWGILHDGSEEAPWITAGIASSGVLVLAVFFREVLLRGKRESLIAQQELDKNLKRISLQMPNLQTPRKLTLERNAAILHEIEKKSEAAKILGKFAEGHKEVVNLCEEYISVTEQEIPKIGPGSPRLAALRKGNRIVGKYHRYHMLQWAEIESRSLTEEAVRSSKPAEKIGTMQRALGAVDFALRFYPEETRLLDSREVLSDFLVSMKLSAWVEKAERAYFKGNYKRAISLYQDALYDLAIDENSATDKILAAERINGEIDRISMIDENKKTGDFTLEHE